LELLFPSTPAVSASLPRILLVEGISYIVLWTAYPVLMIHVSALIDRSTRLPAFITAYNWASVIGNLARLPIALAGLLVGQDLLQGLALALFLVLLGYQWFVTKTALDVGGGMAAGLVMVDFALTLFLSNVKLGMLQVAG
ncbi:MAG TPA: hypothetical protein VFO41_06040, partial [Alphaproteobacteria bacterium]|nr:hypothetical protein [Alphaproteobacteria bacterium]